MFISVLNFSLGNLSRIRLTIATEKFTMSENFPKRLDQAIRRSGLKGAQIARMAEIGPPYLSYLRNGKRTNPSQELITKLSGVLGVNVDWLMAGEGAMLPLTAAEEVDRGQMEQAGVSPHVAGVLAEGARGAFARMSLSELQEQHSSLLTELVEESEKDQRKAAAWDMQQLFAEALGRLPKQ